MAVVGRACGGGCGSSDDDDDEVRMNGGGAATCRVMDRGDRERDILRRGALGAAAVSGRGRLGGILATRSSRLPRPALVKVPGRGNA
jgi:hypothetical protein